MQSEKEMMENRIYELEDIIADIKEELANREALLEKKTQENITLDGQFKNECHKAG